MKRIFDIFFSFFGLLLTGLILLPVIFLVWKEDKKTPFYISLRYGRNGVTFKMVKLRSMVIDAHKDGAVSTSSNDLRITSIGHKIRRYKLDELVQLWNVFVGDMSLVGPRPQVKEGVDLYTDVEKDLLLVRPGITDFSSIVFSDEGEILRSAQNPDLAYDQLIRPWRSRLGLIYIENQSILLDVKLIIYTMVALFSKQQALNWVVKELVKLGVDTKVVKICKREEELYSFPPPGSNKKN
jgi:lipopolysaccharide/colanic/teichoic acid biosynthesis glycosyltransferase